MDAIRSRRRRLGLSQRELAAKAGVAFRTVQLLERGRHDPRWSTLIRIARVLGPSKETLEEAVEGCFAGAADSVAEITARIAQEGEASWKPWLSTFVDAFRRDPGPALIGAPPSPGASPRLQALFASTVECLCAENRVRAPLWCAGVRPLPVPWFIAGVESLKALALVESPAQFRRRNVFVLGNFLERV